MADKSVVEAAKKALVDRLVRETSVTEQEARDLVMLIGPIWPSLVFQARQMARVR